MHIIARLLAACALAFLCGTGARAVEFTTIDNSVVGFATFNSSTQKVVRNRHGTLLAYTKGQNAAYTAQDIRFSLISPEGVQTELLAQTFGTNAPCIDASDTGEFFATFPDWVNGQLRVYVWRDITVTKQHETHILALPGDGKFSCVFDENRRTLYYLGLSGTLVRFRVDTGAFETLQLWTNGANMAQYPALHISRDGVLHVFWNTITGNNVHYRSVQYMASPNDGANWFTTWHPRYSGPALSLPVGSDESGASKTLSRSEDISANTHMEASIADDESFQAVWLFVPGFTERCFTVEKRCSAVYVKHSRLTGERTAQHVPIRAAGGSVLRPKGGGSFVRRGGSVYFLTTDQNDIVLLKAGDFGMTEVQRTPVPNAGPGKCPYSLSAAAGLDSDTDIVGTFTMLDVSCGYWANYTGSTPLMGSVVFFRITL